jgi:hypothetical protein
MKRIHEKSHAGHKANSARNRCDGTRHFFGGIKVHVADELAVNPIDTHVQNHGSRLNHTPFDEFRSANSGYEEVRSLA